MRFVDESLPESVQVYLSSKYALAAYLAYFVPASEAQVRRVLAEVSLPAAATLRVLDVGSGPGPAVAAVARRAFGAGKKVEAFALDHSADALGAAKKLWRGAWGNLQTRQWSAGDALPPGQFEIIVACHALNELFVTDPSRLDRRTAFVLELAAKLAPGGLLVLVEPALRRTGRELLVLRDRLVPKGFPAIAPCLFQGACPSIQRAKDWCHSDRPWSAPKFTEAVAKAAELERDTLKYSYVIHTNQPVGERAKDPSLFRIVSEPLPEKGKLRYFGCGGSGRHPLVLLDRYRAENTTLFADLERGDIIRATGLVASGDGKRLGPTSTLERQVEAATLDDRKPA